jgi:hypothetical protein
MRVISGVLGGVLLLLTLGSILRNVVVPRGIGSVLTKVVWRSVRQVLVHLAFPVDRYERRDRLLAWLAPLVLVFELVAWLLSLFCAYGLLDYAVSDRSMGKAFQEAGSSMFAVVYSNPAPSDLIALDFLAAVTGPLIIALQIAYLPTLYDAYNRRETQVTLLESRASDPAWGPELIARQALIGTVDQLKDLYQTWERLAADIGESHSNYPVLLAFRSPRPYRSWIIALLSVMDAAAMQLALSPTNAPAAEARLMLRSAFTALRDIARTLHFSFDPDPVPDAPLDLTFEDFAEAVDHVQRAGFLVERPAEEAWPHFRGWRVNYESIAYWLAHKLDAVPAPWSGDREWPSVAMKPIRPEDRRPEASPQS